LSKRYEFFLSALTKLLVWGSLFGVLYLLRSFSLLIFLVFIFSYIQANAVVKLEPFIQKRTPRAVLVGLSFLTIFALMLALLVPQIRDQTVNFVENFSHYSASLDRELVKVTDRYPALEQLLPTFEPESTVPVPGEAKWQFRNSTLARVLKVLLGDDSEGLNSASVFSVIQTARDVGAALLGISSQFLLSLLFSFLIVLDLPNLQRGAMSLRDTKLGFVYDEVADNLVRFGLTMGRAFEAQFLVATINTILTAAGIWMIHIRDQMAFLSLVVFLCGFVPIAGVFISSVPICLLALAQGGPSKLFLVLLLITGVHAIESYILNPRIFGSHMKLNPVVVLIIMTISGKLFGVWGLILCIPVTTYVFQDAIQFNREPKEVEDEPPLEALPPEYRESRQGELSSEEPQKES
jgi:predicted PurR-regulated permease PerM